MNHASVMLALAFLRERPVMAAWATVQFAVAIALLTAQMLVAKQAGDRSAEVAETGVDWVVTSPITPVKGLLSSALFENASVIPIPGRELIALADDPAIDVALPILRRDQFEGRPIIGSNRGYLQHFGVRLADGAYWTAPMQAVLGSDVAAGTELGVGDRFRPSHGTGANAQMHDGVWYEVVGVFEPSGTIADGAIATSLESVWAVHGFPPEVGRIDAMLLQADDAKAVQPILQALEQQMGVLAIGPFSTSGRAPSSIRADLPFHGVGGWGVMAIAVGSLVVALVAITGDRRRLIALARVMGAHERRLAEAVVLEGLAIASAGALCGLVLGHVLAGAVGVLSPEARLLGVTGAQFLWSEWLLLIGALWIGLVGAVGPAIIATRVSIAKALSS